MIDASEANIPAVRAIKTSYFDDERGYFSEVFSKRAFAEAGIACDFVQDNHSFSARRGTVRGLHFQSPPAAQHKLIRVIRGSVLDVAVDLRRSSSTFGKAVAIELSADNRLQLYIPIGFAHGFCTLEDRTEVIYKVSAFYAPESDYGLAWDDPALSIDWPVRCEAATLSKKDRQHPRLADLPFFFE